AAAAPDQRPRPVAPQHWLSAHASGKWQGSGTFNGWCHQDSGSQAPQVPTVRSTVCASPPSRSTCERIPSHEEPEAGWEDGEEELIPQSRPRSPAWLTDCPHVEAEPLRGSPLLGPREVSASSHLDHEAGSWSGRPESTKARVAGLKW